MSTLNLLYQDKIPVNEDISIVIPTVGDIVDHEDEYYNLVSILTAMPIDFMVQLDDAGIDFTQINEYELFLLMFGGLVAQDTHLIFGDLDLSCFEVMPNESNGTIVLYDKEHNITIDRAIHGKIALTLRSIHHLEKDRRKPANDEAKKFMLERARAKMRHKKTQESQIESLIIAMVNKEQFKYGYEDVRSLSIYQFNESVRQIINVVDYEHRMHGVYSGTVDPKNMSRDDLNWLVHK